MCNDYNPDRDIQLYRLAELQAMLRYYTESHGPWTIPPFSKEELEEAIRERTAKTTSRQRRQERAYKEHLQIGE